MSSSLLPQKTHHVGKRCMLNPSRAQTSSRWCGVVVRRGVPAQVSSSSLDYAAASSRRIFQAFGDSVVNERMARHWFQKFRSGDLSLCDKARTRRPRALNDEALQAAIKEDSSQTCGGTFQTIQHFQ
ncbi:histone-lysine N-methyltransferase SETMAR [Trichonephila clavipes]|uniref:Histone-lysine N-methyltransferase SETMAR n=1 Tax=Trichonephila clavipes TaxID=2585209 RepID=A0A8X6WK57_TRICX|nr:histone-lysine N-methyltransferase SETMAR [Trichonephila clavipes]